MPLPTEPFHYSKTTYPPVPLLIFNLFLWQTLAIVEPLGHIQVPRLPRMPRVPTNKMAEYMDKDKIAALVKKGKKLVVGDGHEKLGDPAPIILIQGLPGVGKLAVAKELKALLAADGQDDSVTIKDYHEIKAMIARDKEDREWSEKDFLARATICMDNIFKPEVFKKPFIMLGKFAMTTPFSDGNPPFPLSLPLQVAP